MLKIVLNGQTEAKQYIVLFGGTRRRTRVRREVRFVRRKMGNIMQKTAYYDAVFYVIRAI